LGSALARIGGNAFKIITAKTTEKRPFERPRHRQEDNVRMDFKEMCQYEELG
jgi:hypothetical protein